MRQAYVVSYDISDPRRLRRVYRAMRGFGDHLQLSVFRCELNARELVELRACLASLIHHGEDQVLIIDIGPADSRGLEAIDSLGRPFTHPERYALVM
jgi:CRISPR-associated protein Cas2